MVNNKTTYRPTITTQIWVGTAVTSTTTTTTTVLTLGGLRGLLTAGKTKKCLRNERS